MSEPFSHNWMRTLIENTGGAIEDEYFVTRPGCLLLARTEINPQAQDLLQTLHITEGADYERLAELSARLTYLSFVTGTNPEYLARMSREHQHLSVFGSTHVTFLLAGIGIETSLELISHKEARVARLTSSNTKAMDNPYFRLQGSPEARERQKAAISLALAVRGETPLLEREFGNINHPGSKVTALTYTMSLKDFHTFFIGRMPVRGNEVEVREVTTMMCNQLHADYPVVIRTPDEYASMNNGAKYES